jgi:hypothetical protein
MTSRAYLRCKRFQIGVSLNSDAFEGSIFNTLQLISDKLIQEFRAVFDGFASESARHDCGHGQPLRTHSVT